MSPHATQLLQHQLFSALKSQITSLATPLYGTQSEDSSKVYDVVSYIMPNDDDNTTNDNDNDSKDQIPNYGVAIVLYTGPPTSPFTSWTLISHVDNQPDIITGANRLLQDLRKGIGGVIGDCVQTGVWKRGHGRIPDVVVGVGEAGRDGDGEDRDGGEGDEEDGEMEDESEGIEQIGMSSWSPTLESIMEEM